MGIGRVTVGGNLPGQRAGNASSTARVHIGVMSRAFALITAAGSAATFAGVWVAMEPAPVVAAPPSAVVASEPIRPTRRPIVVPVVTEPDTHVVRHFVGGGDDRPRGSTRRESSVYYSGCREVRAAGAAPIYRGQPGYREGMDGDGDGIACEAYR